MKDEGRLALLGGSSSSSVPGRMAELHVSRGLFVRVGRPANTEKVSWLVSDNGNRGIEHLAAELSVHENGHRSQPILTVIINAGKAASHSRHSLALLCCFPFGQLHGLGLHV